MLYDDTLGDKEHEPVLPQQPGAWKRALKTCPTRSPVTVECTTRSYRYREVLLW